MIVTIVVVNLRVRLNTTYFAENWKHCSKIIFKCVNIAMRPIFNENFVEKKKRFVGPVNSVRDPLKLPPQPQNAKKKKKEMQM